MTWKYEEQAMNKNTKIQKYKEFELIISSDHSFFFSFFVASQPFISSTYAYFVGYIKQAQDDHHVVAYAVQICIAHGQK